MEKKQLTNEILISLLMLLFLYAGTMKILHFGTFKEEMAKQIFPSRIYAWLLYLIPATELAVVSMLPFRKSRQIGLSISVTLMSLFLLYAISAFTGLFPNRPCSCGGVISLLTWKQHILFDLFFVICSYRPLKQISTSQNFSPIPVQ